MKVRMKSRMAGPDGNYAPDEIVEFDDETGAELVKSGHAESLEPPARKSKKDPAPTTEPTKTDASTEPAKTDPPAPEKTADPPAEPAKPAPAKK
jgi:hypothetical protein